MRLGERCDCIKPGLLEIWHSCDTACNTDDGARIIKRPACAHPSLQPTPRVAAHPGWHRPPPLQTHEVKIIAAPGQAATGADQCVKQPVASQFHRRFVADKAYGGFVTQAAGALSDRQAWAAVVFGALVIQP
jgi:hypothetical protein